MAIRKTVKLLSGTFALCIMFSDHPDVIYCVRNVSPLVAAIFDEGTIIASDLTALIPYSRKYFVVPEYHILTMTKDSIHVEDMKGNKIILLEPLGL